MRIKPGCSLQTTICIPMYPLSKQDVFVKLECPAMAIFLKTVTLIFTDDLDWWFYPKEYTCEI